MKTMAGALKNEKKAFLKFSVELKQTRQTVNPLALKIWQLPILIFIKKKVFLRFYLYL